MAAEEGETRVRSSLFCSGRHFTGKIPAMLRRLITQGRILAQRVGNQWVVSADTQPPVDKRIKSGKYVGSRKKASGAAGE